MRRENISAEEARHILQKDDSERRKWGLQLYGQDTWVSGLYDLVVHIKHITVDDAADMICEFVSKKQYKTTPESQRMIEDLALTASLKKELIDVWHDIKVCVDNGTAFIETEAAVGAEEIIIKEIREVVESFEGISDVKIECHPIVPLSE